MREQTTANGIRTDAIEGNHGKSHINGASGPPSLFFLFFFSGW